VRAQNIKTVNLWWWGYIFEKLIIDEVEITFRVSAFSFFQTNTYTSQVLFKNAKDMLPKINWNILDLYCWAGTIWITLLKMWIWKNLLWIEIIEDAVKDAYTNAKINWLEWRSKFITDKAENINFESENVWLVVVDPPRSWLHKNVIEFLWNLKKQFNFPLLYISCNPVTMARDLKMLEKKWFEVKKLKGVDMFPHTHHIEMVGLLK
jgi:tRNA/tmRNA/rRNA uracil-C5-methylase (TrmA/RlmC/RlmD family)